MESSLSWRTVWIKIGLEAGGGLAMVAVRSAQRFGNHLVDDAEAQAGRGWSS